MDVMDGKLKRTIADPKKCVKRYGVQMAKKLRLRLDALEAAESLADFWPPYSGPERCHELKADLSGTYSMDAKQPYRLLFRPTDDVSSLMDADINNGKCYWATIKTITLVSVKDTHD